MYSRSQFGRGEDGDPVGEGFAQQLDDRGAVLLQARTAVGEQLGEHFDPEADVALLVLGDVLHPRAEAGHRVFGGEEVLDEVLARLGEAALDDQVVEGDRLRVLGQRAVLAQFLRHLVEPVEDAVVAPVELGEGGGERLLQGVAVDADHLFEEAVEEHRVADLVDLLGGEEVRLLLGRGGGDVGGEGVGDPVLAVEEHRVDPHRRAALDVGEAVPALAVAGEVDVVGAPVALLPALVEVLVGDVLHQALRRDAHLFPLLRFVSRSRGAQPSGNWLLSQVPCRSMMRTDQSGRAVRGRVRVRGGVPRRLGPRRRPAAARRLPRGAGRAMPSVRAAARGDRAARRSS